MSTKKIILIFVLAVLLVLTVILCAASCSSGGQEQPEAIEVTISQTETTVLCDIYASDVLGLIQNDPRYAAIINDTGDLHNSQQKHLEHNLLTVSATVDGNDVNMLEDNASPNAEAPLTVVNTRGFDLPQTGDTGTWMFGAFGVLLMAGSLFGIVLLTKKARKEEKMDR